ncbi:MAG: 4-hydroxy-tetrahydrodipicolinate reductase [Allomuricauda sp.]|nr:MAG: 4-hydroxy-tetrahydrodipicolinate reductase [Allomuricauda sp.]
MNIGLFGYGKMGKMLDHLSRQRGHEIVAKIELGTTEINFEAMDVAIDFSSPGAAYDNIIKCLDHNVPVISGTTGWLEKYQDVIRHCQKVNGAFIYASNFSLGVNIFFELNKKLAQLMGETEGYKVALEEIHHTQKLDAPSGTAITLAEGIIANSDYKNWVEGQGDADAIPIVSKRIEKVPGTHVVSYQSPIDSIQIAHTAHNREGFALGAIIAAEWLMGKKGVYTMKDVLGIN